VGALLFLWVLTVLCYDEILVTTKEAINQEEIGRSEGNR